MQQLVALVAQHGVLLVFAGVLLEQLGLPLPAVPLLIVAGALAVDGKLAAGPLVAASLAACLIGDGLWFWAGRRFGKRVLRLLCRVSLSPDACVQQSELHFERWGGPLLSIAKFIPGLSTMAPPMAGALRLGWGRFLVYDGLGALLWIGAAAGAGAVFHAQVDYLLARLEGMGAVAVPLFIALLALWIAAKWWQRRKLFRMLRMARISADELWQLMSEGAAPVVVDVRSAVARQLDPRAIPGALAIDLDTLDTQLGRLPADREIILYCTCPNEESAARVAKLLIDRGYVKVRPLHGGLDAWVAAGHALEALRLRPVFEPAPETS